MALAALLAPTPASAQNACTGDRVIRSQAQLDTFIAEDCASLSGSLRIGNSADITSLAGLDGLTSVGGRVRCNGRASLLRGPAFFVRAARGWYATGVSVS